MKIAAEFLQSVGEAILAFFEEVGQAVSLWLRATRIVLLPPYYLRIVMRQCEVIGLTSLPVVLVSSAFVGMVFALHSYSGFSRFGATDFTAPVVAIAITREMGPVICAIMVAGRAGAAMAAELGTMRVTEQIDALETLATDPIKYLIVPRLLAATLMLPLLTLFADAIGIIGGYWVSVSMMGLNAHAYIERTWDSLLASDVLGGLMKASVFGFFIALVCCHFGYHTRGGAEGVGKATTKSVVVSSLSILISDFFLTRLLQWG